MPAAPVEKKLTKEEKAALAVIAAAEAHAAAEAEALALANRLAAERAARQVAWGITRSAELEGLTEQMEEWCKLQVSRACE
jgi:hypothetical protein